MRRLNDPKKVADFLVSNFRPDESEISKAQDTSYEVIVPYLPAHLVTLVSSQIRIGVFPYDNKSVFVTIYKL